MSKFSEIESNVYDILGKRLPDYLTYHCLEHTKYVLERSVYIAKKENVDEKDLLLLKVAALFHDIGFIKSNIEHEKRSCKIAKKHLEEIFNKGDLEKIYGMIMATKIPQDPKTKLEEILADADLEYLGTKQFDPISEQLYNELKHYNSQLSRREWNEIQIKFISAHHYHTKYCRHYKEKYKKKNLEKLKLEMT